MYVCICNGISDQHLLEAARGREESVDEIYARLGTSPKCRKCIPHVERILGLDPEEALPAQRR